MKVSLHLLPKRADLAFGQGHDLRAEFFGARAVGKQKRPEQDARAVGMKRDVGALDGGGFQSRWCYVTGWLKAVTEF